MGSTLEKAMEPIRGPRDGDEGATAPNGSVNSSTTTTQDHSRCTAIMAVLNLVDGADHDVRSVSAAASYHEEGETVESALRHSLASAST